MNYKEHEYVTPKEYVRAGSLITKDAIYRLAKACRQYEPMDVIFQRHGRKMFVHPDLLTRLLEVLKANELINHNYGIELTDAEYLLERFQPSRLEFNKIFPVEHCKYKKLNTTPQANSQFVDKVMHTLYNDKWPANTESPIINHTRIVDLSSGSKFYLMRFHLDKVTVHEINKVAFNSMFKGGEERVLRCITGDWQEPKKIGLGPTTKNYLWTLCKDGMIFYNVKEEIVEELMDKCGSAVGCL